MIFGRKVKLQFGLYDQKLIEISGLRVQFKSKLDNSSELNESEVIVYNLNDDSLNKLQVGKSEFKLFAGYHKEIGLISRGDVTHVNSSRVGSDRVTTVRFKDGKRGLEEVYSETFPENTKVIDVINSVTKQVKFEEMGKTALEELFNNDIFKNGISLTGTAENILEDVNKQLEKQWSIQNNKLNIIDKKTKTNLDNKLFKLKPQHVLSIESDEAKKVISTFLDSRFMIGGELTLNSEKVNLRGVIEEISHVGDTHESEFKSSVKIKINN